MFANYPQQRPVRFLILLCFCLSLTLISCNRDIDYDSWEEKELSGGARYDQVLLDYRLGMDTREFYEHGVELNRQGIVFGMSQIEYPFEELTFPATITIIGNFHEGRLYELFCTISYDDWTPWDREYFTDRMLPELIDYFEDVYGSGFRQIDHPEHDRVVWMKIDGNRRISIYPHDPMNINIEFFDLTVSNEAMRHVR